MVICRPLHARYLVSVTATRLAISAAFIVAILVELPTLWTFTVITFVCPTSDGLATSRYFVLEQGLLTADSRLKMTFDILSISLGFLVPVGVLVFCNCRLICSLKQSNHMARLYSLTSSGLCQRYYDVSTTKKSLIFFLTFMHAALLNHLCVSCCRKSCSETVRRSCSRESWDRETVLLRRDCKTVLSQESEQVPLSNHMARLYRVSFLANRPLSRGLVVRLPMSSAEACLTRTLICIIAMSLILVTPSCWRIRSLLRLQIYQCVQRNSVLYSAYAAVDWYKRSRRLLLSTYLDHIILWFLSRRQSWLTCTSTPLDRLMGSF